MIAVAGRGLGPLSTAALLYAGACASALLLQLLKRRQPVGLKRRLLGRLALVAIFGAAFAPTLLAWGLQRTGAMTGSLLLNLEAVFTVLLAQVAYREPLGRRVTVAVALMFAAGIILAADGARGASWSAVGALAVAGATFAWAVDNTLTRPLADETPLAIVAAKGAIGAALTTTLAFARGEPLPGACAALALLTCGATGYGVSLRLYLAAQRRIGAARTGSIFAVAPFVGAAVAWILGDRTATALTAVSAGLFSLGVYLHVTEGHRHRHRHGVLEHEHLHRHDDGHHNHAHIPAVVGEHVHAHRHEALEHEHAHAPDIHHRHPHPS